MARKVLTGGATRDETFMRPLDHDDPNYDKRIEDYMFDMSSARTKLYHEQFGAIWKDAGDRPLHPIQKQELARVQVEMLLSLGLRPDNADLIRTATEDPLHGRAPTHEEQDMMFSAASRREARSKLYTEQYFDFEKSGIMEMPSLNTAQGGRFYHVRKTIYDIGMMAQNPEHILDYMPEPGAGIAATGRDQGYATDGRSSHDAKQGIYAGPARVGTDVAGPGAHESPFIGSGEARPTGPDDIDDTKRPVGSDTKSQRRRVLDGVSYPEPESPWREHEDAGATVTQVHAPTDGQPAEIHMDSGHARSGYEVDGAVPRHYGSDIAPVRDLCDDMRQKSDKAAEAQPGMDSDTRSRYESDGAVPRSYGSDVAPVRDLCEGVSVPKRGDLGDPALNREFEATAGRLEAQAPEAGLEADGMSL